MTHSKILDIWEVTLAVLVLTIIGVLVYFDVVPRERGVGWIEALGAWIATHMGIRGGASKMKGGNTPEAS